MCSFLGHQACNSRYVGSCDRQIYSDSNSPIELRYCCWWNLLSLAFIPPCSCMKEWTNRQLCCWNFRDNWTGNWSSPFIALKVSLPHSKRNFWLWTPLSLCWRFSFRFWYFIRCSAFSWVRSMSHIPKEFLHEPTQKEWLPEQRYQFLWNSSFETETQWAYIEVCQH